MENIIFEKLFNNFYEDDKIFIEIDNRCNDKKYLQRVKENYEKYSENFIKNMVN